MIAFVSGTLVEKKPMHVVIDVHGLGYHVHIPTSTYESLPDEGGAARLLTHFVVREDSMTLYGFASKPERDLFEAMISVTGVGPKLALAALSALRPADLQNRILGGDAAFLTSIPGVGRKTAERLVIELRDRVARLDVGGDGILGGGDTSLSAARADALAALEALGFSRATAERKLRLALRNHPGTQSADELVRLALREQG